MFEEILSLMTTRIQFPYDSGDWKRSVWKLRGQVEPTSETAPSRETTAITLNQEPDHLVQVYVAHVTDICRYIHAVHKMRDTCS